MTMRMIVALGAAIGLAVPLGGIVLPVNQALAQYAPPYPPPGARDYPPPPYRGGVPQDDDDAGMAGRPLPPPPNYRNPPPPGSYRAGPNMSRDPYIPGPPGPPADPRYGYGPPPPNGGPYGAPDRNGDPYGQPPAGGPYGAPQQQYGGQQQQYGAPPQYGAAPQQQYGGRADDPRGRPGEPELRPPGDVGPGQQANMPPDRGLQPGPQQISPDQLASLPPEDRPEADAQHELPPHLRRQLVTYPTREPAGTIIVDTPNTYLYLVLGNGKAMRYGIGVGREGFTWSGVERVSRMAEWPDWHPPKEMIERQPYLPRFMAGGLGNPLGARALYLGKTLFRIHGTNQPSTIGSFVSSGCVRLVNADIEDLYQRVQVGTRVVVLPGGAPPTASNVK